MDDHLKTLTRVGTVLIIIGLLDISVMTYCALNGIGYSSSLNIFAVIAGILLRRGNLATVRAVTWFAALFATAFGVFVLSMPFLQPPALWLLQIRMHSAEVLSGFAIALVLVPVMVWIYRELRSPEVLRARRNVGRTDSPPKSAFVCGSLFVVGLAVLMWFVTHGDSAKEAIRLAQEQIGPGFRFHVDSMRWSGKHIYAEVTAYNEREIKSVEVEWDR